MAVAPSVMDDLDSDMVTFMTGQRLWRINFRSEDEDAFSTKNDMRFAFLDTFPVIRNAAEDEMSKTMHTLIDDVIKTKGLMAKYQLLEKNLRKSPTKSNTIDWRDLRIRTYIHEERRAVEAYLKSRGKAFHTESVREVRRFI